MRRRLIPIGSRDERLTASQKGPAVSGPVGADPSGEPTRGLDRCDSGAPSSAWRAFAARSVFYARVALGLQGRPTPFDVLRLALGVLLLTAATLKGYQLTTEPLLGEGILHWRPLLIGVVEFELFLGLWLLSGAYSRALWWTTLVCFIGFLQITLYRALTGEASCGCFGKVAVNPWYTLVLDLVIVLSLLRWRPMRVNRDNPVQERAWKARFAGVFLVWLALGLSAGLAVGRYQPARLAEGGVVVGDDEFVVLEPEKWLGKPFVLARHIDIRANLSKGLWLVLLYDHSCSACREAVSKYEELARDFAEKSGRPAIAVVEIPPYASAATPRRDLTSLHGRLRDSYRWKVRTPVSILVDQGRVRSVFDNPRDTSVVRAIWSQP